ncbi:unnamed protein product, partial [Ectocarpus fasciculatus]
GVWCRAGDAWSAGTRHGTLRRCRRVWEALSVLLSFILIGLLDALFAVGARDHSWAAEGPWRRLVQRHHGGPTRHSRKKGKRIQDHLEKAGVFLSQGATRPHRVWWLAFRGKDATRPRLRTEEKITCACRLGAVLKNTVGPLEI